MSFVRGLFVFVGAMFLQWWWNAHFAYWGAAPQILLATTIVVAARRGPVTGMLLGWVWGLFADCLRADLFGANALLFVLAAYAAGAVRKQMDLRAVGPLAATVFLMSWMYSLALGLLGAIFLKSFFWVGWASLVASPFLNALAAIFAAVLWEAWEGA
jgi:rod shape-determining protein MreD